MAQRNSQNLVSERSRIRLQAVLIFSCVYQDFNKQKINTQEKNVIFVLYFPEPLTVIYNMYNI